jgi:N-acetylglucosamine-6-sulfatase
LDQTVRRAIQTAPILCAAIAACALGLSLRGPAPATAAPGQPNFVVIMTDDQTLLDLRQRFRGKPVMRNTLKLIAARGAEFRNAYAAYPLSCPSRMTFLTGRHAHNHGVTTNRKPGFEYCADFSDRDHTLPIWLNEDGYETGHVGRYLNGYGYEDKDYVPPGYNEWHAPVGFEQGTAATYRGYYMNDAECPTASNCPGVVTPVKQSQYFTDRLNDLAVNFVQTASEPFFVHVAHRAPHEDANKPVGPQPAAKYAGSLKGVKLPRGPGFDEGDLSDKPAYLRRAHRLNRRQLRKLARRNRRRLESLRSVDQGVKEIIGALASSGRLDDTYIVFESDNGFFRGEHRITKGKLLAYEPASRVPLLIRGPGIPAGSRPKALVSSVDVAATVLDLADAQASTPLDGTSLLPFARRPGRRSKRALLIESYALTIDDSGKLANAAFIPKRLQKYQSIRVARWKYVRLLKTGEQELYDLKRDRGEVRNLARKRRYRPLVNFFRKKLRRLRDCEGASCRKPLGPIPKPTAPAK